MKKYLFITSIIAVLSASFLTLTACNNDKNLNTETIASIVLSETETETKSEIEIEEIPEIVKKAMIQDELYSLKSGSKISINSDISDYFVAFDIIENDDVYKRIYGKSYVKNDDMSLDDIKYLKLLHYDFDHEISVGELIVSAKYADKFLDVLKELFLAEYEINSMRLIDDFWAGDGIKSDTASIDANNTSAFCYRKNTINGALSNHALGKAIDINPQQNPYVTILSDGTLSYVHKNAADFVDRTSIDKHVIKKDDICYNAFIKNGFSWGGEWQNPIDYQHFEIKEN